MMIVNLKRGFSQATVVLGLMLTTHAMEMPENYLKVERDKTRSGAFTNDVIIEDSTGGSYTETFRGRTIPSNGQYVLNFTLTKETSLLELHSINEARLGQDYQITLETNFIVGFSDTFTNPNNIVMKIHAKDIMSNPRVNLRNSSYKCIWEGLANEIKAIQISAQGTFIGNGESLFETIKNKGCKGSWEYEMLVNLMTARQRASDQGDLHQLRHSLSQANRERTQALEQIRRLEESNRLLHVQLEAERRRREAEERARREAEERARREAEERARREEEEHRAREARLTIPPVARGHEQIYQRFLNGRLIYKPNDNNNIGMIELYIRDLLNPLEGEFDLSQCGETSKKFIISTGYRKRQIYANTGKAEIWLVPRFLVENEINSTASHFKKILPNKWPEAASVGIIYTYANYDKAWMHYQTTLNMDQIALYNLHSIISSDNGGRYNSALNGKVYACRASKFKLLFPD